MNTDREFDMGKYFDRVRSWVYPDSARGDSARGVSARGDSARDDSAQKLKGRKISTRDNLYPDNSDTFNN